MVASLFFEWEIFTQIAFSASFSALCAPGWPSTLVDTVEDSCTTYVSLETRKLPAVRD